MTGLYHLQETIAAIATPPGEGGIAIIRISGDLAIMIADSLFSGSVANYSSHTAHLGKIRFEEEVIDQVLLLLMRAPHSFTGEDVVEIHCHGGSLVTKKILSKVLSMGARLAGPGEFSYRAFMKGKIDLTQAEAIQSLISARSELALQAATEQLEGALSKKVRSFQKELIEIAAILEAWVDFPEEGLEFISEEELLTRLRLLEKEMTYLCFTFDEGQKLIEGVRVCLIGPPNVGKSSLMNTLLGTDRAIVTPIAGTTRDLLEAEIKMGGFHFHLTDTAGIRETTEMIEQEGIRRSKMAASRADLILCIADASSSTALEIDGLLQTYQTIPLILVWNKSDLASCPPFHSHPLQIQVSAKTQEGISHLKILMADLIQKKPLAGKEELILTQARHFQSLQEALSHLKILLLEVEKKRSPELLSSHILSSLRALNPILGLDLSEEILDSIFSKFCVGK